MSRTWKDRRGYQSHKRYKHTRIMNDIRGGYDDYDHSDEELYCRERGYDWGGLYEKFGRVSCWCCPLQPLNELRILYFDFPDLWKQLRAWDDATWRTFKPGWSVRKLEARFDFELEWQTDGNQLGTKEFRKALKKRLEDVDG